MLTRIFSAIVVLLVVMPQPSSPQSAPAPTAATGTIACRALETLTDDGLKIAVIVFHQRDEEARSQLGALLREHSGETVEVQAGGGAWRRARLARLKSCFGRGLLMLPSPAPFSARGEFVLRLPAK